MEEVAAPIINPIINNDTLSFTRCEKPRTIRKMTVLPVLAANANVKE